MTDSAAPPRPSAVRILGQTLRTFFWHLLPLLLVLTVFSLPMLASRTLEGIAEDYSRQWLAAHQEAYQSPASISNEDYLDLLLEESRLRNKVNGLEELSSAIKLVGNLLTPALLIGANGVLIAILRGREYRWRNAFPPFRHFGRALLLEIGIGLLLVLWGIPFIFMSFFTVSSKDALTVILYLLFAAGATGLVLFAWLRYLFAPFMLADGKDWDVFILTSESARLVTRRSIGPMLLILSPALVLAAAAALLSLYVLPLYLSGWAAGLVSGLLMLPCTAYLHTAAAAIYVHFQSWKE